MVLNAVLIVVLGGLWLAWERRRDADRPADEEFEAREGQHGLRLVIALASLLLVLVVGLALDGLGVDAAGWFALLAVVGMLVVFYAGPWVGPRRPGRRRQSRPS
jgi:peptidoglycan/LPS O-acetylase OafA/YrhL